MKRSNVTIHFDSGVQYSFSFSSVLVATSTLATWSISSLSLLSLMSCESTWTAFELTTCALINGKLLSTGTIQNKLAALTFTFFSLFFLIKHGFSEQMFHWNKFSWIRNNHLLLLENVLMKESQKTQKTKIWNRLKKFCGADGSFRVGWWCSLWVCHYEVFFFSHYQSFNMVSCIICVFHRAYNRHRHYKLYVRMAGELCHIKIQAKYVKHPLSCSQKAQHGSCRTGI